MNGVKIKYIILFWIKNFIRAQSEPYPGAFTIINNKKVVIYNAKIEDI